MNKFIFSVVMLLPLLATAQKVPLLTIKEGEEFDSDNSKLIPTATGATWQVVTTADYKNYFLYDKTVKGKLIPVDIRPGRFITEGKEGGKEFFRVNTTGIKYGPYEGVSPKYDEDKKIFYGYSYAEGGKNYYVDAINNKTYGPYNKGGVWFIDDKNLVYTNAVKNETTGKEEIFLFENDKKYGPYESATYKRAHVEGVAPLITWQQGGRSYTNAPQCKGIAFAGLGNSIETKGGWLIEGWEQAYMERKLYLPDGSRLDFNDKVKHMVNAQGEFIKMEQVAGGGSYAAYKLTYKGKEVGTYAVQKWNRQELNLTDFFDHQLMKVEIKGNWSNASKDVNYVYSASRGLIGPYTEKDMRSFLLMKDGYAVIKGDSTLEINGKKMMDKIVWADVKEYPTTWWAFQKRGDYVYPFKNGTEVKFEEVPEKLKFICTYENDLVRVQRKNDFFIRRKGSNKLMGPVGQFDPYVVSPDGKYWATERGEDGYVVINGKPVAKGHLIVYNEKLKAFHWFVLEGQKVSMYTHKLESK